MNEHWTTKVNYDDYPIDVLGKGMVRYGDLTDDDRMVLTRQSHIDQWVNVTRSAAELAYTYGLDPTLIEGSGKGARVLKADVEQKLDALRDQLCHGNEEERASS